MKKLKVITKDKDGNFWNLCCGNGCGHILPSFNPKIFRFDKITPISHPIN